MNNTTQEALTFPINRDQPAESQFALLAREVPVAFYINDHLIIKVMATPANLDDFAIGFMITSGIVDTLSAIESISVQKHDHGHDLFARTCQNTSLTLPAQSRPRHPIRIETIYQALAALPELQTLSRQTNCAHAAAWSDRNGKVAILREDVARHVAFDKLIGAKIHLADPVGFAIITSRVSHEIIRKAAKAGIYCLVAVSVPTAGAADLANSSNITLIGAARLDKLTIFTHPKRIITSL